MEELELKESNEQIIKIGIAALVIAVSLPVIIMVVGFVGLGTIQILSAIYNTQSNKSLS